MTNFTSDRSKCPVCDDDGYVEVWDEEGDMIVATHECPRLLSDGHAPFNATGILGPVETDETQLEDS